MTDQRSEDNLEMLRSLLEEVLDNTSSKSEQKAKLLYRSCLDSEGRLEHLAGKPLEQIISDVGGWNLTSSSDDLEKRSLRGHFDLKLKLISLQKYNTNSLFHWYIREGMHNTSQYEVFIHQGKILNHITYF